MQINRLLEFVFEDLSVEMGLHFSSSLLCKGCDCSAVITEIFSQVYSLSML